MGKMTGEGVGGGEFGEEVGGGGGEEEARGEEEGVELGGGMERSRLKKGKTLGWRKRDVEIHFF